MTQSGTDFTTLSLSLRSLNLSQKKQDWSLCFVPQFIGHAPRGAGGGFGVPSLMALMDSAPAKETLGTGWRLRLLVQAELDVIQQK